MGKFIDGLNVYAMYAGDINADGIIDYSDNDIWKINVGLGGYFSADCDIDGQNDNVDKNDMWIQNIGVSCQVPE